LKDSKLLALKARKGWPSSVKSTMRTDPAGPLGLSAGSAVTLFTRESGKSVA
jgi:hypothetical protein